MLRIVNLFPDASLLVRAAPGWQEVMRRARGNLFIAFNFADFGRSGSHYAMLVGDLAVLGSGDLWFCKRQLKTARGQISPKQWLWPADSCPDLLRVVRWWKAALELVTPAAAQKVLLWQLPWETRWGPKSLVTVLRRGLQELDVAPPPGFAWTLKCIRSGAASAAAAIDISLSKIRRQGDWSASSMVPERKYIDAMVVSTDAARRFFGWLSHGA